MESKEKNEIICYLKTVSCGGISDGYISQFYFLIDTTEYCTFFYWLKIIIYSCDDNQTKSHFAGDASIHWRCKYERLSRQQWRS